MHQALKSSSPLMDDKEKMRLYKMSQTGNFENLDGEELKKRAIDPDYEVKMNFYFAINPKVLEYHQKMDYTID